MLSDEKFAFSSVSPSCNRSFTLAAFEIVLTVNGQQFNKLCLNMINFVFEVYWTFLSCIFKSFSKFGNFSAIFFQFFSTPICLSSISMTPMTPMLNILKSSHKAPSCCYFCPIFSSKWIMPVVLSSRSWLSSLLSPFCYWTHPGEFYFRFCIFRFNIFTWFF